MLPGFSAEHSLYQSRALYVSVSGALSGVGEIAPAAANFCYTPAGGKTQCGIVSGVGEGILVGVLVGAVGGGIGSLIGGLIGGVYCWIFGCD
jgi:hypothetical protein